MTLPVGWEAGSAVRRRDRVQRGRGKEGEIRFVGGFVEVRKRYGRLKGKKL